MFSSPDNLIRHLQDSGLFKLGVNSAALFWSIVNSTWSKGSTTPLGYKAVMRERIAELFPDNAVVKQPEISWAAANFVEAYLGHSKIDEQWRLILEKLSLDESVTVIIATDHYAEATGAIIKNLAQWDIPAMPLKAYVQGIVVANSADIGRHKAEPLFWQTVKNALRHDYTRILLIDDFGQNEQQGDDYGGSAEVNKRRQRTVQVLRAVFAADVESIAFALRDEYGSRLIAETSATIDQFLC